MRKYQLFLFVVVTILFNINTNSASAFVSGCRGTSGFSLTTGESCLVSTFPLGCTSDRGYSPTTGVKCYYSMNVSHPSGCTSAQGYSPTTGIKCDNLVINTPDLIPGCTSTFGFSVTTGMPCSISSFQSPVIEVNGPKSLNVNQQGTWTITAYDKNGGNLSYSVDWGDGRIDLDEDTGIFSASYPSAGIYIPTFTVRNSKGYYKQTSLNLNVGNVTNSSPIITILSPNRGMIWQKGQNNNISWIGQVYPTNGYVQLGLHDLFGSSIGIIKTIFFSQGNPLTNQNYIWDTKTLTSIGTQADGTPYPVDDIQSGSYKIGVAVIDYDSKPAASGVASADSPYFTITN